MPKPVVAHERDGTYRADRHAPKVIGADFTAPKMPPGLTPSMKVAWCSLIAALAHDGTLNSADEGTIEAAAVLWGRAREARSLIALKDNQSSSAPRPPPSCSAAIATPCASSSPAAPYGRSGTHRDLSRAIYGVNLFNSVAAATRLRNRSREALRMLGDSPQEHSW
jgi:hypothetical protein